MSDLSSAIDALNLTISIGSTFLAVTVILSILIWSLVP